MQLFQPPHQVDEHPPDQSLGKTLRQLLLPRYLRRKVAVGSEFHHNAVCLNSIVPKRFATLVHKRLLVTDHVQVVHRSQNTNLVQRIFLLFRRQTSHLHPLQRVDTPVLQPPHLVHRRIGSVSQFSQHLEVFQRHALPNY